MQFVVRRGMHKRAMLLASTTLAMLAAPAVDSRGTAAVAATTLPPPITAVVHTIGAKEGDFFLAPQGQHATYANGPEIVTGGGKLVWFKDIPAPDVAKNLRVQTYHGQQVLTWWQGHATQGSPDGIGVIADAAGNTIATVNGSGLYPNEGHDFVLFDDGDKALITEHQFATADLTSIGGPSNQAVMNCVIEEIDVSTGQVLFSWNSADHVPFSQSHTPLPASAATKWDWFHLNSVDVMKNGNFLVSGRKTWAAYAINSTTGNVLWTLGGNNSTYQLDAAAGQHLDDAGEIFAWQHDARALGGDRYSFFDNEGIAGQPSLYPNSRGVVVQINRTTKTATLIRSYDQPDHQITLAEGNMQTLPNGRVVIGWGTVPSFSEFAASGAVLDHFTFPDGVDTYRVFRSPWPPAA